MSCHSDQRQQIELADCVVGGACVLTRGCALTVSGGKQEVGSGCAPAAHLSVEWQGSEEWVGPLPSPD